LSHGATEITELRHGPDGALSGIVLDAALNLHRNLGPGLLESIYEVVLARDLARRGLTFERQKLLSFEYEGMAFKDVLRIDLLVEGRLIVEIKSTEQHSPVHFKQTLTYLRLLNLRVGLLLNFGMPTLKQGLRRVINGFEPLRGSVSPCESISSINEVKSEK